MIDPKPGSWGVSGNMVVEPTDEEVIRRCRERELPFTSRRIAVVEPSRLMTTEEADSIRRAIASIPDVLDTLKAARDAAEAIEIDTACELLDRATARLRGETID